MQDADGRARRDTLAQQTMRDGVRLGPQLGVGVRAVLVDDRGAVGIPSRCRRHESGHALPPPPERNRGAGEAIGSLGDDETGPSDSRGQAELVQRSRGRNLPVRLVRAARGLVAAPTGFEPVPPP